MAVIVVASAWAAAPAREFDLRSDYAAASLKVFAQQAGIELLIRAELGRTVRTSAIKGTYTPEGALTQLLKGTGLEARADPKTGVFTIVPLSVATPPAAPTPQKKTDFQNMPTTPASPAKSRNILAGLAALFTAVNSPAQRSEAASIPPPKEEEAIVLSPFTVTTEQDTGYAVTSTLAGTRLKTDLRDVPAAVTIVTKDFLRDVGANDLQGLLVYTAGTEVVGLGGNFSAPGQDGNFADSFAAVRSPSAVTRVRGLSAASLTRDYFISDLPVDDYIVDRVEISRGPNAMLFGLGSPGGIINSSLIQANFQRTRTTLEFRYGQHGSTRSSLDHNYVLVPGKLALRVAGLYSDTRFQQEPSFERRKRAFVAATYKPWSGATLRANAEIARDVSNRPQISPPFDHFTYWWAIGQPSYDPSTGTLTLLRAPASPAESAMNATGGINGNLLRAFLSGPHIVVENPSVREFGIGGLPSDVWGFEGFNNRSRLNPAGTAYVNEGMRQLQWSKNYLQARNAAARPEMANFWRDQRISDPAIFNFYDHTLEGPNKNEWGFWEAFNVTFEQRLGRNAGVEVAYNREFFDNGYVNALNFRDYAIRVDINSRLPNGVTNPNYGRPYVTDVSWQQSNVSDRDALRATAYYDLDLIRGESHWFKKLLGRHVFTGSFTGQKQFAESLGGRPHLMGLDYYAAEAANENYAINTTNGARFAQRLTYVGPSLVRLANPEGARIQPVTANTSLDPYSSLKFLHYQTPPATPVATPAAYAARTFNVIHSDRYEKSRTANFTTARSKDEFKSYVLVANSKFWKNTLVTTVGWRRDAFRTFNAGGAPVDPSTGQRIVDHATWSLQPGLDDAERSFNYGGVLHLPPRLRGRLPFGADVSLTYNKSDNFTPTAARFDMLANQIAPSKGETIEHGVVLSLLAGKLQLRANRYETAAAAATNGTFNEIKNRLVRRMDTQIENNANPAYQAIAPASAISAFNTWVTSPDGELFQRNFNFTIARAANGSLVVDHDDRIGTVVSTSDLVSRGYEFDAIFNPTRNWRIAFNAVKSEAVRSNTARDFAEIIRRLAPIWGGTAGSLPDSIGNASTLGDLWGGIEADATREILLDGATTPELRKWRFNVISNYTFSEGRLRGFSFGGAFRWQDKVALGYPVRVLPGGAQSDVTRPFYGPTETNFDAWLGYSRRVWKNIAWSVRLNLRNVGVRDELIPVVAQPDGSISSWRIKEPQTWTLTNRFEF